MSVLKVSDLTLRRDDGTGSAILQNVNLDVQKGDVVIVSGPSGCGKTTLLKCMAELNVYQGGQILLYGKTAEQYGIPNFRTRVQYVPQRPSLLPGNPIEFLDRIKSFASRKARAAELAAEGAKTLDPMVVAEEWGVERYLWTRDWSTLSGGEGQRIALAIAICLGGADVVLLDEPTSALDETSAKAVERTLLSMLSTHNHSARDSVGPKAYVWITHSAEQGERVGNRKLNL